MSYSCAMQETIRSTPYRGERIRRPLIHRCLGWHKENLSRAPYLLLIRIRRQIGRSAESLHQDLRTSRFLLVYRRLSKSLETLNYWLGFHISRTETRCASALWSAKLRNV